MDSEVMFSVFKNIIVEQNKVLLQQIAKDKGRDERVFLNKYLQPEFYLPIITKHGPKARGHKG